MKKTTFIKEGSWYKGNTHLHTTKSDGRKTQEEVIRRYRSLGYHFMVMSDHNLYFDSNELDEKGFLILPGIEYDAKYNKDFNIQHHVTAFKTFKGGKSYRHGQQFEHLSFDDDNQYQVVNQLIKEVKEHDNFTILAHPNWSCLFPEDLLGLEGYDAIEVWNNECDYASVTGNGEYYYDYLLKKGKRVMAIASDDTHSYDEKAIGGFIVVKAKEYTKESIASSIAAGSYYSSTGPEIHDFYIENNTVYVKCSPCERINLIFHYRGKGFFSQGKSTITEIEHKLNGEERYVRGEVVDFSGKKAWTNPIYLD